MKPDFFIPMVIASMLIFAHSALAQQQPPEPQKCPSEASIKAYGVSRTLISIREGLWTAGRRNFIYDTTDPWSFVMTDIPATTISEGYDKAVIGLSTLQLQLGPTIVQFDKWACLYSTIEGYSAATITPPIVMVDASRYLH